MRFRTVLSYGVLIGLASFGAVIGWQRSQATPVQPPVVEETGMKWGMNLTVFPYPYESEELLRKELPQVWDRQLAYLNQADIRYVRVGATDFPYLDQLMDKLRNNDLKPLLIIEDHAGPWPNGNEEQHGYEYAKMVVERYGDAVEYYQLANEIGGSAIRGPEFPGTTLAHFDPARLKDTLDFVRGAGRAIGELDPTAQRVLTINSLHVAVIEEAVRTKVPFDIIGWNWFSDFGTTLTTKTMNEETGETYPFLAKLQSFQKPLWLTEVAWRVDDRNKTQAEDAQAAFLRTAVATAQASGFEAIFPFILVEDVVKLRGYGLLKSEEGRNGLWSIVGPTSSFLAYQGVIASDRN